MSHLLISRDGPYQYRYRKYRHIGTFFSIGSIGISSQHKFYYTNMQYRSNRHIGKNVVSAHPYLIICFASNPLFPSSYFPMLSLDLRVIYFSTLLLTNESKGLKCHNCQYNFQFSIQFNSTVIGLQCHLTAWADT